MELMDEGKEILRTIEELGYKAYMVGGCVRDYLLNQNPNDIDMTTNMPKEEIKKHFDVLDNGGDYESVTILYHGNSFEITHFRKDVSYSDHRHPEVALVDTYMEDAARRDFTVNALAMDKDGKITDYYHGLDDLKNKTLRMIGNPFDRFEEDALRILRGLYFSSKLGFELDSDTLFAMIDKKELLASLSEERLYQYFIKILYAPTDQGIRYINECDIFQYIPSFKRWLNLVDSSMEEKDLMLIYYGKMKKFPKTPTQKDVKLAEAFDILSKDTSPFTIYHFKQEYLELKNVLKHYGCDIMATDMILAGLPIKKDSELAVPKEEIASHFEGKKKGEAIHAVLKAVLNGDIENTRENILLLIGGIGNV